MTFHEFSSYLDRIQATTLRNAITEILAELFKKLDKEEIEPACWLLLGRIVPPYEGLEFQFAEKMLMRAVASAYNKQIQDVLNQYKSIGDLAEVTARNSKIQSSKSKKTVTEVYLELEKLAKETGEGSQEKKLNRVIKLLQELDPISAKYIVRIILTRLRLGFSDMTILDSLSWAKVGDKSERKALEDAYQMKQDIGKLAQAYLRHGAKALEDFEIELGIPLQPALCQRLKSAQEMIDKMTHVIVEPKYDGTRVQIHIKATEPMMQDAKSWKVRTFTRSLEESSAQFPELREACLVFDAHDLILDCEAIGYDRKTGKLLPFQETIQRKRKHDVESFANQIPLKFFVFDVLYKDGENLTRHPLHERKNILHTLIQNLPKPDHVDELGKVHGTFIESPFIVTTNADELRDFHKKQLEAGLEGAVIKQYDSVYQPGRRGWSWVKFKEEETAQGKLSDTIDAVVMGYWYGKGKRNQFGVGAFLIGVLDHDERIVTISKVGTGLSDEQWRELKKRCETLVTIDKPTRYIVDKLLSPDVWVDPKIVVEVAGDELTKSPNHSAHLALRFPRLVRFRDDKNTQQLTTIAELNTIT